VCAKCSTHGDEGNTHDILVRDPHGKGSRGRLRRTWEDNIKMDLDGNTV